MPLITKKTDPGLGMKAGFAVVPLVVPTSAIHRETTPRHHYLIETEKQRLYWREAARREAEPAKPWDTHKD